MKLLSCVGLVLLLTATVFGAEDEVPLELVDQPQNETLIEEVVEPDVPVPCPLCLYDVWYNVSTVASEDVCSTVSAEDALECMDDCIVKANDKPESYLLRQMTQLSDIFYTLKQSGCSLGACSRLVNCINMVANYENPVDGSRTHAPYNTVFNYNCSRVNAALTCVRSVDESCYVNASRVDRVNEIFSLGLEAACTNPRRCITGGRIYEVKPGTDCVEFYHEAMAKGPSLGKATKSIPGLGFDTNMCIPQYLDMFECPADPAVTPIYSEFAPGEEPVFEEAEKDAEPEELKVDTSLSCEKCLEPVWLRVVTVSGSYMCEPDFQSMVIDCLQACRSRGLSRPQLRVETMVKIADINKAFKDNGCDAYQGCTREALSCMEELVSFLPEFTNHITVNSMSCDPQNLTRTTQCLSRACGSSLASLLSSFVHDGYGPICYNMDRCLASGNIFEYVSVYELGGQDDQTPCAYYRQARVNGWEEAPIVRVQPGLLFSMQLCRSEWAAAVDCPL